MPDIGSTLADLLIEIGIRTPDELFENGTFQAFFKIIAYDTEACIRKLCAIEDAIEGIRWHKLSKEKEAELKQYFTMINK